MLSTRTIHYYHAMMAREFMIEKGLEVVIQGVMDLIKL